MDILISTVVPILVTLIASSGFWTYIMNKQVKKSMQTELLIGLAHDRLVNLGLVYITRGWITQDEYENMTVYLFRPYQKLGGNGSVNRIMLEVDKLPIKKNKTFDQSTGETIP
jgi:hypothetical protein